MRLQLICLILFFGLILADHWDDWKKKHRKYIIIIAVNIYIEKGKVNY
jgi:hypothetical protein